LGGAALNLSLLPHDRVAGERRWLWRGTGDAEPWQGARVEAAAESASDHEIWKDLRRRLVSPTPRLLERDLHAEQRFALWEAAGTPEILETQRATFQSLFTQLGVGGSRALVERYVTQAADPLPPAPADLLR
jgi:hypothetical protein